MLLKPKDTAKAAATLARCDQIDVLSLKGYRPTFWAKRKLASERVRGSIPPLPGLLPRRHWLGTEIIEV